ncbi:hypothetical protein TBLA_0G01410 [Henningerozyma blattae CBS 6284]|uniref:Actin interacting protein 3 C-terminal domain-containing protein n=1 Tax=Henningerozyma blattae (strain ATCC 34711 / CBS 6284 / DSM 70876 / NBRC 10599 / NRRL Y-10934 / UCD 77-7) TaxID=1071380 RepID=I2H6T5_HENB6|nr:hypothetical protein TBLA_0G01410 [Tetrapisispora blattae CBS 6284]CCH62087.1 hypothetical protein TBLA_0G01410 [Tetrapisispora blattae CBS 6284]
MSNNPSRKSSSSTRTTSSIESMVTKLLMSTKQLLQTLTQWSKNRADEQEVSDVYVQLGNDFKVVSKYFQHAGIDVSDLGNVPLNLRRILEEALSELPSDETLNKYLPSIREIIVQLLDNLKKKQNELKMIKKAQAQAKKLSSHLSTSSSNSNYSTSSGHDTTSPRSSSSRVNSVAMSYNSLTGTPMNSPYDNALNNGPRSSITSGTSSLMPRKLSLREKLSNVQIDLQRHEEEASTPVERLPSPTAEGADALSQLKNGSSLQRRASKRYSAYHMAKLTNQTAKDAADAMNSSNPTPMLPNNNNLPSLDVITGFSSSTSPPINKKTSHADDAITQLPPKIPSARPKAIHSSDGTEKILDNEKKKSDSTKNEYVVFLKLKDNVKKCVITKPSNLNELRLLFVEKFSYTLDDGMLPDIYVKDNTYSVFYQLDDQNFHELYDGCILELHLVTPAKIEKVEIKEEPKQLEFDLTFEKIMEAMKIEIHKSQLEILNKLKELSNTTKLNEPTADLSKAPQQKEITDNSGLSTAEANKVKNMKHQISILRQIHKEDDKLMKATFSNIVDKIEQFKALSVNSSESGSNEYMEKSKNEVSDISDALLSKVDDLQDNIELLRKDVADRGVRPSEKKINSVEKELESATINLENLRKLLDTEKPHWKKHWENLLNEVCEDQQFLALQVELISDLETDLQKSMETFKLVKLCCEERKKNPNRPKMVPILPATKPGEAHDVREKLLNDVQSMIPDHESRIDALERAEKLWEKERIYKDKNTKFENELGTFVQQSNLKNAGGIEEVDRMRDEKDKEHFRVMYEGF